MSQLKKKQLFSAVDKMSSIDVSRFVKSSLFNEVLAIRDLEREMSSFILDEETSGFIEFWFNLCSFAEDFNDRVSDLHKMNSGETLKNFILPILEILGYGELGNGDLDHFVVSQKINFPHKSGGVKETRIPISVVDTKSGRERVVNGEGSANYHIDVRENIIVPIVTDYFDSISDMRIGKYQKNKNWSADNLDEFSHLGMESRCVEYCELLGTEFGIVTDGAVWRLVHKERTREDQGLVYEFDLQQFLGIFDGSIAKDNEENENFLRISKWFYWFFSKKGLHDPGLSFVSEVEIRSKKYKSRIEDDMKTRFVHAITLATNGYIETSKAKGLTDENLDLFVMTSESLIFNLFFLRSCESRGVIPFHQGYKKISLANIINKIQYYLPELSWKENELQLGSLFSVFGRDISESGTELYTHVHELFKIIKNGKNGFGIDGFIETVFCPKEFKIFNSNKLNNKIMLSLIHELMFYNEKSNKKQVPYNSFSPRQLGSIYESFLEFRPMKAETNLYYLRKETKGKSSWQWVKKSDLPRGVDAKDLCLVKKGRYIFSPDNIERRSTGAYYTPHYVVEYLVEKSLGHIVDCAKTKNDILKIRVCDPAMGSAHFLVEVLNYLTNSYIKLSKDYEPVEKVKRRILDKCIFGVDINPRAVKLAKMSLWLASAFAGKKLERLDDQLVCGNTLVLDRGDLWSKVEKFDAIVGNPPYVDIIKIEDSLKEFLFANYSTISYRTDLYNAFLEKSMLLTKEGGAVGMIVNNSYLTSISMKLLREKLIKEKKIMEIVDLGGDVFEGVNIESNILIFENEYTKGSQFEATISRNTFGSIEKGKVNTISQDSLLGIEDYKFEIYQDERERLLIANLSKLDTLGCHFTIKQGIRTGDNKKFIVDTKKNSKYKKLIRGRDVNSFSLNWGGEYLLYDRDKLDAPRDEKIFKLKEKIYIRQTGDSITACLADDKFLPLETLHVLWSDDKDIKLKFVEILLNSSFYNNIYKLKYNEKGKAFAQVKIMHLKTMPFFKPTLKEQGKAIKLYNSEKMETLEEYLAELFSGGCDEELVAS